MLNVNTSRPIAYIYRSNQAAGAWSRLTPPPPSIAEVLERVELYLSVALVRTRTIPTERPPPVGEVSANFCG